MSNPFMWLLSGSIPLGTYFGIRVRMHAMMVVFIAFELLGSTGPRGIGFTNALTAMSILFISVLLHEFGHCFGARWTGGHADDILMWPLGGLAFTSPPHRWTAHLVTTVCGPAVNVVICILTGTAVAVLNNSTSAVPWFPLRDGLRSYVPHDTTTYYLWWIFLVNYAITAFNALLLFYPFDGGRIVQALLWWRTGYHRSMRIATVIGMVGAVVAAVVGIAVGWFLLILIAAFGFYESYRSRQVILASGPYDYPDSDFGVAYDSGRKKRSVAREVRRTEKRRQQEQAEQRKIDAILAKVSAQGMQSLSWWEKRVLRRATERQRTAEQERARRMHR